MTGMVHAGVIRARERRNVETVTAHDEAHDDSYGHAHSHSHGHSHGVVGNDPASRAAQQRALRIALVANGGFLIAEVVGGIAFRSLALLADAAHMFTDVVGLVIALVAQSLLARPSTPSHTYGFQRAEVLGGQTNALLLIAAAGWIAYEAIGRIGDPVRVQGTGMLIVAALGLLVNVGSAVVLVRARGRSLNMQGAYVHMVGDAAGSVAAIVAAIGVIVWRANWLDPVMSVLIAVLVVWSAVGLLRETTRVLLEGAPADVSPNAIEAVLLEQAGVVDVHHTHVWSLASDVTALSTHVVLDDEPSLHVAQERGEALKEVLHERLGIAHATIELECHPCEPDLPHGAEAADQYPDHVLSGHHEAGGRS